MTTNRLAQAVDTFAQNVLPLSDVALESSVTFNGSEADGRLLFFDTYLQLRQMAVLLAHERASNSSAITPAQHILTQHHIAYRNLQGLLAGLQEEETSKAPEEGEWSVRETFAHLIFAERRYHAITDFALRRARAGEPPAPLSEEASHTLYHLDDEGYTTLPFAEMRAYFDELHARILKEFARIGTAELETPVFYWQAEPYPLRFRLHRFDAHLREHTVQIEKTMVGIGHHPSEIERLLRLIYEALGEAEGSLIGAEHDEAESVHKLAEKIVHYGHEIGIRHAFTG